MSKTATRRRECGPFFDQLQKAGDRTLVLDYEGTIAPLTNDRNRTLPYSGIPGLLAGVMETTNTRVIVLAASEANHVLPLLGMSHAPEIWGSYGLERIYRDGRYQGADISDDAFDALAEAEVLLEEAGLGPNLALNPAAVAVHCRGLTPMDIMSIRAKAARIMKSLAACSDLVIADFDGGVEIRVPSACAGDAIRSVLAETPPSTPIAYLGDDTADEAAFRTLNGRGLTVLVGPRNRFTAAQMWLRPPDELTDFLKDWIDICARGAA